MVDTVLVPRWAVEQVLDSLAATPAAPAAQALAHALEQPAMWDRVQPLLDRFAKVRVPLTPRQSANADQLHRYTANLLSSHGLDPADGHTVFTVVVMLAVVSQLAANAANSGEFTEGDALAVRSLCRALGLAFATTVPEASR